MASVGPQNPSATANTTINANDIAWASPGNVFADDAAYATCNSSSVTGTSKALDVTGFDFSAVPSGATIDGIVVEIDRKVNGTLKNPRDSTVQLLLAGSPSGSNYADTGTNWPTTQAYKTYGGAADKWGITPSQSDVTNSGFGVRIRVTSATTGAVQPTYSIDHVRITVYYTASGGGGSVATRSIVVSQARTRAASY